jgi:pyruvate/2-oxoacid:ferredoxin oxidoreductase alpha subunit
MVGALQLSGNPSANRALVAIGTIGDSALELLDGDADLLVVRVHAYRPFPAAELSSALADASYITVVDRAAAFGSLGPLGGDVRSLRLHRATAVTNFVCGLGGVDVTPATLRWALSQTQSSCAKRTGAAPIYVPEGV